MLLSPSVQLTLGLMLLLGAGCASAPPREETAQASSDTVVSTAASPTSVDKRIEVDRGLAPGHQLRISQLEDERLNGKFRMDFEGRLHLPYGISLKAKGLTLDQLHQKIEVAYRPFFKSSAPIEVDVSDASYWVEVRGLVVKPGRILVKKSSSLDEVLAMAGGPSGGIGSVKYAKIIQGKEIKALSLENYSYARSNGFDWRGGDLLFFQKELDPEEVLTEDLTASRTVKVMGEVRLPGNIGFKKNMDFFYYLEKAGGPTSAADLDKIELVRGKDFKRSILQFTARDVQDPPRLEEGDSLIVHVEQPGPFMKFVTTSSSVLTLVTSIVFLAVVL